jgi:hypothetical protein
MLAKFTPVLIRFLAAQTVPWPFQRICLLNIGKGSKKVGGHDFKLWPFFVS